MEPIADWEGETLLDAFLQNKMSDHKPRALTGRVDCNKEGNVMTVQSSEYLDSIFKKLSTENFLSAPVCRGSELVGQITMLDLVRHVNSLFFGCSEDEWIDWWEKQLSFQLTPASQIVADRDEYLRNPFPTINENFTSFFVLELMARNRIHSVFSTDDTGQLNGILTQSMLVSFLRQNKAKWGEGLRNLRVADFKGMKPKRKLQTVRDDSLAINAFLKMDDMDVHGLPIVDRRGVLTGCISVRDLRGVGVDGSNFSRLYQTVSKFKTLVRQEHRSLAPSTHYSMKNTPATAIYVTPEDTMEDVIARMDDGNLHRIFVCSVESANRGTPIPTGVISQSDVLQQALDALTEMAKLLKPEESPSGFRTRTRSGTKAPPRQSPRKVSQGQQRGITGSTGSTGLARKRSVPIAFA